jgi:DnaJ domain
MFVPEGGGELIAALVNAVLLALWAALPGLILGYFRQAQAARKISPDFALRKSETAELDRAVWLYDEVRRRLDAIEDEAETPQGLWHALFGRGYDTGAAANAEHDDLQAHAQHLQSTIMRLRRRPLRRLRAWVHAMSLRWALATAVGAYGAGLALIMVASQGLDQAAWADELNAGAGSAAAWYPLDARLFYANAVAAAFAAGAAALFYLLRRRRLLREHEFDFRVFADLAASDPLRPVEPSVDDQWADDQWADDRMASDAAQPAANENDADTVWFAVLGLTPLATIEDVKDAYKTLIKQNHPDRLHDMSPALQRLAEAETKKINAAYEQALLCVAPARECCAA